MIFGKVTTADRPVIERFVCTTGENNCETAYINMLVWQGLYDVSFCAQEDALIVRASHEGEEIFSLPFGNVARGVESILRHTGGRLPVFRAQEGPRLDEFVRTMGDRYDVVEQDEGADYIYRKEDLATLAGKKYHAKRNHISAFSRQFAWSYEPLNAHNREDAQACADRWYAENADRLTPALSVERDGVATLLAHFDELGLLGAAIRVDGQIVAFCIASRLNDEVVDVHVEKALAAYEGAYAVVNNQFAKHLPGEIRLVNREDDMGLEGLRKAKLSYHPVRILKKYLCLPRDTADEVRAIYTQAFGESPLFDGLFFHAYRDAARSLRVEGKTVSILFLLPCTADGQRCYYLFAAATDDLISFYEGLGFHLAKGVASGGDIVVEAEETVRRLSAMCEPCPAAFPLMTSVDVGDKTIEFPYIMQ